MLHIIVNCVHLFLQKDVKLFLGFNNLETPLHTGSGIIHKTPSHVYDYFDKLKNTPIIASFFLFMNTLLTTNIQPYD